MTTNYVVVELDSKNSVVTTAEEVITVVDEQPTTVVTSGGIQGPQGPQGIPGAQGPVGPSAAISTASDVDVSTKLNGSLLIYNQSLDKWVANNVLSAQYVDAGEF